MKKLEIKKTLNPVSVYIVDDDLDRVGMLVETVAATGNKARYANSYESAVDGRAECYDIIACDVFLHEHDPNKGTGFDYKASYKKIHKDTIFLMYSGNKRLIAEEALQMEVLDAMQIQDALAETIDCVDRTKTCNNTIKDESEDKPKAEPKEEDKKQHSHSRSGDKKGFWQIQNGLLSIFLTVIACGGTFALIKAWGQSSTTPFIIKVAGQLDSTNHKPLVEKMVCLMKADDTLWAKYDSVSIETKKINCKLDQLLTMDQKIKAANQFNAERERWGR